MGGATGLGPELKVKRMPLPCGPRDIDRFDAGSNFCKTTPGCCGPVSGTLEEGGIWALRHRTVGRALA